MGIRQKVARRRDGSDQPQNGEDREVGAAGFSIPPSVAPDLWAIT